MHTAEIATEKAPPMRWRPSGSVRLQRKCACGGTLGPHSECAACRAKRLARLQRSAVSAEPATVPPSVHDVLRSPGQPLDAATRGFMEPRFGHDFSQVRVHADASAAASARDVHALAYTVGQDVVFGAHQYAPQTPTGKMLLAHELTHVVQQAPVAGALHSFNDGTSVARADSQPEREADDVSGRILTEPVAVRQHAQFGGIQRAAPAAAPAAAGIGVLAAKCIVSALIGVALDYATQAAIHMWRSRTGRFWEMTVDWCSIALSAALSCIGGIVAFRWLGPWLDRALGPRLAGISGPLIGRLLIFIARTLGIAIPKGMLKLMLKLGCVSPEQAEAIAPGISTEIVATSEPEQEGEADRVSA